MSRPASTPNDVFHATRLPFDPGSTGLSQTASRRPTWRSFGARSLQADWKMRRLKLTLNSPLDFQHTAAEDLSLSGGASIRSRTCFKLSITFVFDVVWSPSETKKATRLGRPRLACYAARGSSAKSSQRGLRRSRAGESHLSDARHGKAGTAVRRFGKECVAVCV